MNVSFIRTIEGSDILAPNPGDVGFDMLAASEPKVMGEGDGRVWQSVDFIEYDTGIVVAPDDQELFSMLMPRSSISKYWLTLANGVGLIDNGYRGTVRARFKYNWQFDDIVWSNGGCSGEPYMKGFRINMDKIYKKGDKIAQLVFARSLNAGVDCAFSETFTETARGSGGFGSTGS